MVKRVCKIMQLLLLFMIFKRIYGLVYEKEENRNVFAGSVMHVENDVPSELTCVHICLRLNSDVLYKKRKCYCARKVNLIPDDTPLITGTYIKKVSDDFKKLQVKNEKDEILKDIGPVLIKNGQQIAIISKMKKSFHIQAIFEVDKSMIHFNKWHNLLHITIGGDKHRFGDRNPSIFLKKESSERIILGVAWPDEGKSDKYSYCNIRKNPSFFDSSFKVDYIQNQTSSVYLTRVLINDIEVVKRTYSNPREIENLFVYAGNPWYYPLKNSKATVRFLEGVELKSRFDQ